MFGRWKSEALALRQRLARAEYRFDVEYLYDDGSTSLVENLTVVDGTLTVFKEDTDRVLDTGEVIRREVVLANIIVHKVVDGVIVNAP